MNPAENSITCRTPAKVNLILQVNKPSGDGYHPLVTVFVPVSIYDTLTFQATPGPVEVTCRPDPGCSLEDNLVYRCAMLLKECYSIRQGARIDVTKQIPSGAGLGGGSSDGACALSGLCRLWGIDPSEEDLRRLARMLGSDVPFFLNPVPSLGQGRGDILSPLKLSHPLHMVIVCPPFEMSTPAVYQKWDKMGLLPSPRGADPMICAMAGGDPRLIARELYNDLEAPAMAMGREIDRIKKALLSAGALGSLMSGSGSGVFGIYACGDEARTAAAGLGSLGKVFYASTGIDTGQTTDRENP